MTTIAEAERESARKYDDAKEEVRKLLDGLSNTQIREFCTKALREWRAKNLSSDVFSMHGALGLEVVPILADNKGAKDLDANVLKEPFLYSQDEDWMAGIVEFICWMVSSGLAVPLVHHECREGRDPRRSYKSTNGYPANLRLTARGKALLDKKDEDHPLLPGFATRVQARCPGLPALVVALLTDAYACLSHGLLRPAVGLLGVAYETATDEICDRLSARGIPLTAGTDKAWKRIASAKAAVARALPGASIQDKDKRTAAEAAYDFADTLRRRRNDAAHATPTYEFDRSDEIEELVVSAARHLPALWSLA